MANLSIPPHTASIKKLTLALCIVSPLVIFAFAIYLPPASDFIDSFWPAAHLPLDPYSVSKFLNPPWVALLLYPLTFLSERAAQAIIAYLNLSVTLLLITRYGGSRWSFLLTLTSAPFLSLLVNGNMDWLPMTAFLLPAQWGLAVMLSKPQVGLMAGVVWLKQVKRKDLFLIPAICLLLVSFLVWGNWVVDMFRQVQLLNTRSVVGPWNIAPFPWLVPVGLWLLYLSWKQGDVLIAIAATLCLTPYIAFYSLTAFLAVLSARNPRAAVIAWIVLWTFFLAQRWIVLRFYV